MPRKTEPAMPKSSAAPARPPTSVSAVIIKKAVIEDAKIGRFVRKRTCRGWLKNCSKHGFPARTSCSGKWCATNQNFLEGDPGARKIEASWPARLFGRARSVYIRRHPHHLGRKDRISLAYEPVPQARLSGADQAAARAGSFDDTILTLLSAIRDWDTPRREFEAMWPIRPPTTSGRAGGIRRQKSRTSISATRTVLSTHGHRSRANPRQRQCRRPRLCVLYRDEERSPSSELRGFDFKDSSDPQIATRCRRCGTARMPAAAATTGQEDLRAAGDSDHHRLRTR